MSVSTNIIKTLSEREWVRVVGHRDVPGKPALYATTKEFLDYFNLKGLSDLPTLAEIRDLDSINRELELRDPEIHQPDETEAETDGTDSLSRQRESETQQVVAETLTEQLENADELIEADPDGETDSGVMHRSHEEPRAPTMAQTDDLTPFDSDGETDSSSEFTNDDEADGK